MKINFSRKAVTAASAALALLAPAFAALPAQAGIFHKHPMLAGAAAGLAAHHMAKRGAQGRMAHGGKPNFAERHPMMSGVAAGALAHHMAKKH